MALENSNNSDLRYNGICFSVLYNLETDTSRPKMVGKF
jgi:hypothetical protein